MGRPRSDANTVSTPERILAAAELTFAAKGFTATTLADIAKGAGIRRPSLLYHFANKEQLYEAVVIRAFASLGLALRSGRAVGADFEQRLESMTRAFVNFAETRPEVPQLIIRELIAEGGPGTAMLLGQVAPILDEIERWLHAEGQGALRPGIDLRAALVQVASDTLLRCASGALRDPIWGPTDANRTWRLVRTLMFHDSNGGLA